MLSLLRANWKRVLTMMIWILVGLNVVYFVRRAMFSTYCSSDAIVKQHAAMQYTAWTSVIESCMLARNDSTPTSSDPSENNWCMYDDEVDLRIIIMTFNRHASLLRLLSSVSDLEVDGDSVSVEIWIDRDGRGVVDEPTLLAALSFRWSHGRVRVHVHRQHVGVYGQWMATWRPRNASTAETALLLEDDITISPFAYRWLRAARRFYAGRRDVAGFTLQSEGLIRATDAGAFTPPPVAAGAAFLYALMGSWGFAPRPDVWIGFQDWYAGVTAGDAHRLRPIVPGIIMSTWYEKFEGEKKADTMWTMWFIYYCSQQVRGPLYTVYNNVHSVAASITPSTNDRFICINRREAGLHYSGKPPDISKNLLRTWRPEFAQFSQTPLLFNYSGDQVVVTANNSPAVAASVG